jgi:Domain of unknown function (DUF4268)
MSSHAIPTLGRLETIPIREVWTSEPYAFDPWLMQPENLQFLAESLGIPGLELVQAQQPIGPFAADLVCRIIDSDTIVLIENQLDQADHRHLGQVLTYVPHVDARLCVWVAEKIRDEHRAAVDWLNRITGEGYAFFGVEVRAVRIGDSLPAPLFEVVAKPNDWSKIITPAQPAASLSDSAASNIAYWQEFHRLLTAMNGPLRKASTDLKDVTYWAPIANSGRAYIWAYRSHGRKPYVVAGISLYNAGASEVWHGLKADASTYEQAFGEHLRWHANKTGTAFHIQTDDRPAALETENWPSQHQWLADRMVRFENLFSVQIKQLIDCFDAGKIPPVRQSDQA